MDREHPLNAKTIPLMARGTEIKRELERLELRKRALQVGARRQLSSLLMSCWQSLYRHKLKKPLNVACNTKPTSNIGKDAWTPPKPSWKRSRSKRVCCRKNIRCALRSLWRSATRVKRIVGFHFYQNWKATAEQKFGDEYPNPRAPHVVEQERNKLKQALRQKERAWVVFHTAVLLL